jgi:hypothetical protein
VRAGDNARGTRGLGWTLHVETEFTEKPGELDRRVPRDRDLGPGAGLAVAIDERRPVLRERLAGVRRTIETLASKDE